MTQKKIDPSISGRLTAAIQLLAVVVLAAQLPNVSTPLLLAAMTLAGLVIGASGRPKPKSSRSK
ncbi:hypothetical protein BH93_24330 [Rhodococcoides fascians A25f]|uniref:hypothetical protein n=1 Tax=Rhodococcoides fascians TaxID=1828 RepID=UPI00055C6F46|nr:hypothetical protein [Rhodococcus fascians]QII08097.1 hypothetical protein BH93_24330 [Rhodococcus fascians A25f]